MRQSIHRQAAAKYAITRDTAVLRQDGSGVSLPVILGPGDDRLRWESCATDG